MAASVSGHFPPGSVMNPVELADQTAVDYFDFGDMRMQWGVDTSGSAALRTITLPAPFANNQWAITLGAQMFAVDANRTASYRNKTTTSFQARAVTNDGAVSNADIAWYAIGVKP